MLVFYLISILIIIYTFYLAIKSWIAQSEPLSKSNTLTIRGMVIICVILHHITQYFNVYGIGAKLFLHTGYIFVGIFFALSGYGNYISYSKNKIGNGTTLKWTLNRIIKLYISCSLVIIFSVLSIMIFKYENALSIKGILKYIVTLTLPKWNNWYLKVQLILYIVFALIYRYVKKYKLPVFSTLIILMIIAMYVNGLDSYWYNSNLCFCLGIFLAKYKENIMNMAMFKKITLVCSLMCFTMLFIVLTLKGPKLSYNISSIFISICFVAMILILDTMIPINSRLLSKLGNISLQVYLVHFILIEIFRTMSFNVNIEIVCIFIFTLIISILFNRIEKIIQNNINYFL